MDCRVCVYVDWTIRFEFGSLIPFFLVYVLSVCWRTQKTGDAERGYQAQIYLVKLYSIGGLYLCFYFEHLLHGVCETSRIWASLIIAPSQYMWSSMPSISYIKSSPLMSRHCFSHHQIPESILAPFLLTSLWKVVTANRAYHRPAWQKSAISFVSPLRAIRYAKTCKFCWWG